jgi:hypothetical protein
MPYKRCLMAVALVAGVILSCGGAYYWFTHAVHASLIYELEARFETLPPDDKALKAWIQTQPGVVSHTVSTSRFDPDRKLIAVMFVQVRNLAGDPPIPDLNAACARFGYASPGGPFRDAKSRDRVFSE